MSCDTMTQFITLKLYLLLVPAIPPIAEIWYDGLQYLRQKLHWFLFIYEVLKDDTPPYFSTLLNWSHIKYTMHFRNFLLLSVPQTKTYLGKTAFSSSTAATWDI